MGQGGSLVIWSGVLVRGRGFNGGRGWARVKGPGSLLWLLSTNADMFSVMLSQLDTMGPIPGGFCGISSGSRVWMCNVI